LVKLRRYIDGSGPAPLVRVSMQSVKRIDVAFAREAIIALVPHYRGSSAICLVDLADVDVFDNVAAAAVSARVPLTVWNGEQVRTAGKAPSPGNRRALALALSRSELRATQLAAAADITVANASTKLKQLSAEGFLLRRQELSPSGGIEFVYRRIG
jgi:hypothetical protein